MNETVALIGLFQKELGNKKAERLAISNKTFGNVPVTGELSNQIAEGMRKIFELEPLLKRENSSSYLQKNDQKPPKKAI